MKIPAVFVYRHYSLRSGIRLCSLQIAEPPQVRVSQSLCPSTRDLGLPQGNSKSTLRPALRKARRHFSLASKPLVASVRGVLEPEYAGQQQHNTTGPAAPDGFLFIGSLCTFPRMASTDATHYILLICFYRSHMFRPLGVPILLPTPHLLPCSRTALSSLPAPHTCPVPQAFLPGGHRSHQRPLSC